MNHVRDPRLSTRIGYSSAEVGMAAVELFLQVYLMVFYTNQVGMEPVMVGSALALGMLWDAISDPLMGRISDRTRSRMGPRRPYLLVGGPLLAAAFVLLFTPMGAGSWGSFFYLLATYVLLNTALTILSVPHLALAADMSSSDRTRNQLYGLRFLFTNLGLMAGILIPAIVFRDRDGREGPMAAALIIGALVVVTSALSFRSTAGVSALPPEESRQPLWQGLWKPLKHRAFMVLVSAFVIGSIGRALNSSLALFYYDRRLHLSEDQVFMAILLPFVFVIGLSILAWLRIAERMGKTSAAMLGIGLLGLYTTVAYPLFPAGQLLPPVIGGLFGGFLVGSVFLLDSAVADLADEEHDGHGIYFGFWRCAGKIARALGLVVAGFFLGAVAPNGNGEAVSGLESHESFSLALAFGPGVGIWFMVAVVPLLWLRRNHESR